IGIVNFEIFEGNNYLTRHLILNKDTLKRELTDFEFNFIELPKFTKTEAEVDSIIEKWIYFIKNAYSLEMVPVSADFVEIKEAYEIANEGTWSKKEFEVYEYWQMRLQDERGALENSFDEGKLEGLLEGIEGMLEIKHADEAAALMDSVRTIKNVEHLQAFKTLLRKSASVDELWSYLKGA
ncbi:MAG: PD-(D/E)XK nuclease family transposase, partial [Magnetococcales bacterium]|nr:PD-(D/E)XK nuclease family transposase [Nitrospirota bacterium]